MDDNTPTPSTTPPPAARTAQALRELHDRARNALAAQRERMVQLEAQLTHQLDSIAGTLADQIAEHSGPGGPAHPSLRDVEQLRAELEKTRLEWSTERDAWQAERAQLAAADFDRSQSLDERQEEIQTRQQTLDDRAAELNHQDRELRQRQETLDSQASQIAEQQSQLTAAESALEADRADLTSREAAIQASQELLERDRTAQAAERDALQAERQAVDEQRNSLTTAAQLSDSESAAKLASVEQQLATERTAWDRERNSVEEQRRLLAKERDDLATALEAARNELATARANAATAVERDEIQHKLNLAVADMERFRTRVAELEDEVTSRPVADETETVELVHLRAERDALAERVSQLEQESEANAGDSSAQDSDSKRRLELAVEDVRDLKKRNAELEARLAAGGSGGAPAASGGGGSWEAMKKQMLANLEGEGDDVDQDRRQERASIENTIRITDEAVARMDREIADLKSQLAEKTATQDDEALVRQLLDTDAVIAEHRARVAQLEAEMQEKLRTAELELSVERAKITRDTAHLAELKAEIDSQRANGETPVGPGGVQHPKRRWLSKLGLSGDENE